MATEVLDILVRERGSSRASKGIINVGRSARTATRFLRLFSGALAAVGVAASAGAFLKLANQADELDNRLRVITGSEREVNALFNELLDISTRTRGPLEGTINLFQRMSIAAGELGASQQDILGVTEQVGKLLAIQGGNTEKARGALLQLSQSFSSGIVRGEEFNAILEGGFPIALAAAKGLDRAAGSVGKLRTLIIKGEVTSREFFEALQSQGAATDAIFDQTQVTVKQAFTIIQNQLLATVRTLNKVFTGTEIVGGGIAKVAANLQKSLLTAIANGLDGFADLIDSGADVIDLLENIGINATSLGATFDQLANNAGVFFNALGTGFQTIRTAVAASIVALNSLGNALGVVSDEAFAESIADLNDAQADLVTSAAATNARLVEGLARTKKNIDLLAQARRDGDQVLSEGARNAGESAREFANRIREARDAELELLNNVANTNNELEEAVDLTKKRNSALRDLAAIEADLRSELEQQVFELDTQIGQLSVIENLIGQSERVDRARNGLLERRSAILDDHLNALQDSQDIVGEAGSLIEKILRIDDDAAAEFQGRLQEIIADGLTAEDLPSLKKLLKDIEDRLEEQDFDISESLASSIRDGVEQGLRAGFSGEGFDFAEFFQERLADAAIEGLDNAFDELEQISENAFKFLGKELEGTLGDAFKNVDTGALAGGLFGIGASLIGAAFGGGKKDVQTGLAESAVTSTQKTRGIVAGPTNIPVFQVGDEIADAFVVTNSILEDIRDSNQQISNAINGLGAAGAGGAGASEDLGTTSSALN